MNGDNARNNDFLIEVMVDGAPAYVHCRRNSDDMTGDSVQGLPVASLEQAFRQGALRAIPMPGERPASMTFGMLGQSMDDGQSMNNN